MLFNIFLASFKVLKLPPHQKQIMFLPILPNYEEGSIKIKKIKHVTKIPCNPQGQTIKKTNFKHSNFKAKEYSILFVSSSIKSCIICIKTFKY